MHKDYELLSKRCDGSAGVEAREIEHEDNKDEQCHAQDLCGACEIETHRLRDGHQGIDQPIETFACQTCETWSEQRVLL